MSTLFCDIFTICCLNHIFIDIRYFLPYNPNEEVIKIHERLKKLRKRLELTQQEFADRIGSKRNTVAKYETEANTPSAAVVSLICREFNVNENWLRTGDGNMFLPTNRRAEIEKLTNQLLSEEENSFKNRFVAMLADLSVTEWEYLEFRLKQLYDTKYQHSEESTEMTVEDAEAAYIKSRSEAVRKQGRSVSSTTTDAERKLG